MLQCAPTLEWGAEAHQVVGDSDDDLSPAAASYIESSAKVHAKEVQSLPAGKRAGEPGYEREDG